MMWHVTDKILLTNHPPMQGKILTRCMQHHLGYDSINLLGCIALLTFKITNLKILEKQIKRNHTSEQKRERR